MKIVFIGGVKFSHAILETILKEGFVVDAVFSYDKSKEKNYSDYISFDQITKKHKIKHVKVMNINDIENIELIKKIQPDLILVMGWSQLLKNDILTIPEFGVIGSHPTQLPKYRGRAPIPWTILKKLKHSALTFFFIEEGIDNGDILDQKIFEIDDDDDATSVYYKITVLGEQMIIDNLNKIKNNTFLRKKQNTDEFIENWPKRTPDDGKIHWNKSSNEIQTLVRATTYPYPGAFTILNGKHIKIWKTIILDESFETPGKIIKIDKNGVQISTINSSILILQASSKEECNLDQIFSKNDIGKLLL